VLAVLVERRRSDGPQLTAGEHRLEHVRRVDCALGSTGADDRVQLVDEEDDLAGRVLDLREDSLEPFFELAAVLRAGEQRADVERPHALALEPLGNVSRDDPLRQPFDDRGLPDAGLADEDWIVLRPAREDLHDAPDLLVAPDDGVQLPGLGERREVASVLLESLVRALRILGRDLLAAANLLERGEQRVARNDVEREEEMFDGDVLVPERAHLVERLVEHAVQACRNLRLDVPARHRGLLAEPRLGFGAQVGGAVSGAVDERARQLLVEKRNRQMIRCQLGVAATASQLLRRRDSLLRLDGELLEIHVRLPTISRNG
jgi:hypothetical protein